MASLGLGQRDRLDAVTPEVLAHPLRRWLANVALALGSLIVIGAVVAAGGEVAFRYRERHRSVVPGTMPLLFYRHVRLRHAFERNAAYFGWVHVNAAGFRGTRPTTPAHDGVQRIMVVGASTTFDWGVTDDDHAWPARLEYYLQRRLPDQRIEVVNAGVPGYTIVDNLIRLETELYQYQPDVVLYYEAHNDLIAALRAGADRPPPTDTPQEIAAMAGWRYWLSRHSLFYAKVAERIAAIHWRGLGRGGAPDAGAGAWPAVIAQGTTSFSRNLTTFLTVARRFGMRVGLAEVVYAHLPGATPQATAETQARWRVAVPFASPDIVMQAYARYNAVLDSVAAAQGIPCVRTAGFGLDGLEAYAPDDPIHFNDAGADRMAREMADQLLATSLVTGAARRRGK
jgi:lysophospholipase L1-like esterase